MNALKIFAFLIIIPAFAFSQIKADQVRIDTVKEISLPPIKYNYKNCGFTIKTKGWDNGVVKVITTLSNNSDDTLKYKMETCWFLYYKVDNGRVQLQNAKDDCLANIPGTEIILPHQSRVREMNLIMVNSKTVFHGKIRMAFYLRLQRGNEVIGDYLLSADGTFHIFSDKDISERSHWIWSNFVNI